MKQMWDERYGRDEYAYGEDPNAFFKACLDRLPAPGRLLLPGEGEGRNAVYAARQGWRVYAFDFSVEGREKALRLADRYGVELDYEIADYETADIELGVYDAAALIFTHMHQSIRRKVHRKLAAALRPGGHLFLEAYSPEQLRYRTGGPPNVELLYAPADLREDFSDLDIVQLEQVEAEIHEGQFHTGLGSVVRLVATR
ncbi:MAG: class I SAM-dependent methyltransferase [Deltaproteobacteria bacterium]|nr:class I SAM-dependent methyltransferase [Deltaproteobacteria bacterium]NND27044.1 class I SAM-dependent methyltransferase [Myxococcales bacterium]MBT8467074.1 class I SAM-dependent methyltransferase [Deltaproteobacteria bacterium]MBT8481815.1 class I SAM-dependent methyltransferase [Deltaproteobacteria bacterium]NNK08251.1 class I SAM-dependent methyltransferase [Myxococcales bacterium]